MTRPDADAEFTRLPDLAARRLGGAVIDANDDFFADRAALVMPYPVAEHLEFGHRGKVYDGWETRRRREPGVDHAVVRLGVPGIVHGVVVDTAYFTGNYPPHVSVDGAAFEDHPTPEDLADVEWTPLVPKSKALGDHANVYEVTDRHRWTHLRLTQHPDGGVARFRVHGEAVPDPRDLLGTHDVASGQLGGRIADCSNLFYSSPSNLLAPGPARNMGEGWETSRRRTGGNDWVEVTLAGESTLRDVVVDTSWFLGNAPGEIVVSGSTDGEKWTPLVPRRGVRPDTPHRFRIPAGNPAASHVRVDIHPDGVFARLRVHGSLTPEALDAAARRFLDALPPAHLRQVLASVGFDEVGDDLVTALTTP